MSLNIFFFYLNNEGLKSVACLLLLLIVENSGIVRVLTLNL